ncbi:hypothetical protein RM572_26465 [Streptomyces sp. DSM 42041]|uniref:Uncharacterized protein n=1 Tax=Streptomyces hazeniae TaxID=3075538 RepID=A0ABU2P2A7_9ACTN|nr:hypothetical protein [Streptomyces sp. DSM 42041]MDT0382307.1 hypothetical protein [Streptomyces sp. DSM 42041]
MPPTDSTPPEDSRSSPRDLDLRLDGFEAADHHTEVAFWHAVGYEQDAHNVLAEHHTPDGSSSYYVAHNSAVTWGIPGDPQIAALQVKRDLKAKTFTFEHVMLPLPAMAQSWLISRGCPRDAIRIPLGATAGPADEAPRALEERLMGDGDHFALGYSYTSDDLDDMVIVAATRDLNGTSATPYRVLLQEVDTNTWTYTLREGGFATADEAVQWCRDRLAGTAGPLPPVRMTAAAPRPPQTPPVPGYSPPGRSR